MSISWLDNETVTAIRLTEAPFNRSVTGYGGKIPTRWMLRIGPRWHRIYVMRYANSGTAYVCKGGLNLVLETETEHRIDRHRDGAGPDVAINTLAPGDRFRFHHDGVVCTLASIGDISYRWDDYRGEHSLHTGTYAGTGKPAFPYVYPTEDPQTEVRS